MLLVGLCSQTPGAETLVPPKKGRGNWKRFGRREEANLKLSVSRGGLIPAPIPTVQQGFCLSFPFLGQGQLQTSIKLLCQGL